MNKLERRYLGEFRADHDFGKLVGYAVVWDAVSIDLGGFVEVFRKGAFTESLKTSDIRATIDHDFGKVIGRQSAGTLTVKEDDHGLRVEIVLPPNTEGNNLLVSVTRGDLREMSFGFRNAKVNWLTEDDTPLREVVEAEIFEVSVVAFPCYEDSSIEVAKRSYDEWQRLRPRPVSDRVQRLLKLAEKTNQQSYIKQ